MSSLKLIDGLKEQEVYAVLRDLLPDEKSDKRRIARLETFVCQRASKDRDWVTQYALSHGASMSDEELEAYERREYCISPALLYQYGIHVRNERYWSKHEKTPESQEMREMEAFPGRFDAKYPQNRNFRMCRTAMEPLMSYISDRMGLAEGKCSYAEVITALAYIVQWHPEFEDGDRIIEVKSYDGNPETIDMVIQKANGEIWGEPTKTFEQIAEESVIARSRKTGVSGRPLDLSDPFLGLLKQP